MSDPILDFAKADAEAMQSSLRGPEYDAALEIALEAQAQAAVTAATELKYGDLYENFRQARFRYERAKAKLAAQADPLRAEHQRLKDAVVEKQMAIYEARRINGPDAIDGLTEPCDAACHDLAAFEAQHPEVGNG